MPLAHHIRFNPRPLEAAKQALPRSCHGVYIEYSDLIVDMGRIVGDGALNFEIVDVAVDPEHQGKGLGWKVMEALMSRSGNKHQLEHTLP